MNQREKTTKLQFCASERSENCIVDFAARRVEKQRESRRAMEKLNKNQSTVECGSMKPIEKRKNLGRLSSDVLSIAFAASWMFYME
jgi:hypothetical protein